jgi:hypothetical protein
MKVIVEFESWIELEEFRTSGKKTRGKGQVDTEEVAATVAAQPAAPQFNPAAAMSPPSHGFPGGNSSAPVAPQLHPIAAQILQKIDGSLASGQSPDAIVAWFRQQLGPEAANVTFDQLKQMLIPRIPEAQLKQIAPQLGIML